jgi:hypothetical protein
MMDSVVEGDQGEGVLCLPWRSRLLALLTSLNASDAHCSPPPVLAAHAHSARAHCPCALPMRAAHARCPCSLSMLTVHALSKLAVRPRAQLSSDLLVVPRIEIMRLFFVCPELRSALSEASTKYPTDDELLRTWRHDDAWQQYKHDLWLGNLRKPPPDRGRPSLSARESTRPLDVHALPRFAPSTSAREPALQGAAVLNEESSVYKHWGQYLDKHVLPVFDGLALQNGEKPPPYHQWVAAHPQESRKSVLIRRNSKEQGVTIGSIDEKRRRTLLMEQRKSVAFRTRRSSRELMEG